MHFHRKFIWFGKIRGSSTVNSPSVPKKLPKICFFVEKPSFTTVWGEPLGNLGESTARNRPCGKWPVGKPISLESGADLYILGERGLDFDGLGEPRDHNWTRGGFIFNVLGSLGHSRAASGSFGEPRRTVDDDDTPGYHHPPTPSRPGKKYVVRPGSSLRL